MTFYTCISALLTYLLAGARFLAGRPRSPGPFLKILIVLKNEENLQLQYWLLLGLTKNSFSNPSNGLKAVPTLCAVYNRWSQLNMRADRIYLFLLPVRCYVPWMAVDKVRPYTYDALFLPARRYASAGNSDRNVSVRPSVRPSRAGIVSKRRKLVMIISPTGSPKTLVF